METTVRQRLIEILENKKITPNALSKQIGIPQVTVNNYVLGKRKISFELIEKVALAYPDISTQWLLTGEGNMLKGEESNAELLEIDKRVGIPLVSQYAYGGYLGGYSDRTYIESLPLIDFTPDREMTGNWLAFEVRGDSMDDGSTDGYIPGEIVICREVETDLWKNNKLHYNKRDFVIVHEEGILIKRVIGHNIENHSITIHSLNPLYNDREINLAQVRQIFSVVESRRARRR